MSDILVINLRRSGDILSTAHIISNIKAENPHAEISLLVYKDSENAAKTLADVQQVFVLNRKEILTLKKSPLYSDGFALDSFWKDIKACFDKNWLQIVNLSNDSAGTFLNSAFRAEKKLGVHYDNNGHLAHKDMATFLYNDVAPGKATIGVHFQEMYQRICGISGSQKKARLVNHESNTKRASENILKFKNENNRENHEVVGIQMGSSSNGKSIQEKEIVNLINQIQRDTNFIPALLVAPNHQDRELARDINAQISNPIITIEFDFIAGVSVFTQIDYIITPDTSIKHLADQLEIPVLEVSQAASPLFKQGAYFSKESIILSRIPAKRSFCSKQEEDPISAVDIFNSFKVLAGLASFADSQLSPGLTLYKIEPDSFGQWYRAIAGEIDVEFELNNFGMRYLCSLLLGEQLRGKDFNHLSTDYDDQEIQRWVRGQQTELTQTTKSLLTLLRLIKNAQADKESQLKILENIQCLHNLADRADMIGIACSLFRAHFDRLESGNFKDIRRPLEKILFELKHHLVYVNTILQDVGGSEDVREISR